MHGTPLRRPGNINPRTAHLLPVKVSPPADAPPPISQYPPDWIWTDRNVAQHARMPGVRGRHNAQAEVDAIRDVEVVRRYEAGETLAGIGAVVGLTRERVRQIVKVSGAPMPRDYKCAVKACETSLRTLNSYCQVHQLRFERFGDPLGTRPRLMDQHGTLACYKRGRCRCDLCRHSNADRVREYQHRLHPEMRRYTPRRSV